MGSGFPCLLGSFSCFSKSLCWGLHGWPSAHLAFKAPKNCGWPVAYGLLRMACCGRPCCGWPVVDGLLRPRCVCKLCSILTPASLNQFHGNTIITRNHPHAWAASIKTLLLTQRPVLVLPMCRDDTGSPHRDTSPGVFDDLVSGNYVWMGLPCRKWVCLLDVLCLCKGCCNLQERIVCLATF
jgi:hypothetical protein